MCNCGRRVPVAVDACRCGAPRPEEAAGEEIRTLPRWMKQLGGIVLLVSIYFGSRGCNRWQTSREARNASVEALSQVVGAGNARTLVDRHHDACFDETYRTGWGRRQAAKFDEDAYAKCIIRAVDTERRDAIREARVPIPVAASTPAPTPPPSPTPTPMPEPDYGLVTLGDFQVTHFKREPNVRLVFKFVAVGQVEALKRATSCMIDVQCGGQRIPGFDEPTFTDCELELDGIRGRSDKAMSWGNTTPVQGDCMLRFAVVRNSRLKSNEIVVDLKETPGP